MISFTDLLTASDAELVKIFYKVKSDPSVDFIKNINSIAEQMDLNHSQLVCAIGFNKNIRDLTDIITVLGFKSYKVMIYRRNELFTTDTYQQLGIDNILDIYSARLEDAEILETLREMLHPRLQHIETDIEKLVIQVIQSVIEWSYIRYINPGSQINHSQKKEYKKTLENFATWQANSVK